MGDTLSTQEGMIDSLLKDAELRVSDDAEVIKAEDVVPVERPRERETEADKQGDVRRLDRRLDRTLYLVVKGKDGWGFPADMVQRNETLHVVRGYMLSCYALRFLFFCSLPCFSFEVFKPLLFFLGLPHFIFGTMRSTT